MARVPRVRAVKRARVLVWVPHRAGRRWTSFLERTASAHLRALRLSDCELSVSLVGDEAIRALNRAWLGKDQPTDVLSFPLETPAAASSRPRVLGDIVVSLETAERQARAAHVPLREELARYLAHGLLHLLGHDHHRPIPRRKMAALEAKLLGKPGMIPP